MAIADPLDWPEGRQTAGVPYGFTMDGRRASPVAVASLTAGVLLLLPADARAQTDFGLPAPAPAAAAPTVDQPAPQGAGTWGPAPGWVVNLGVTVSGSFTNNGNQGDGGNRRNDFVASVAPTIAVTGDTPRTRLNLYFQPTFNYSVNNVPHTYVTNYMNANLHSMIVEDLFYVDAFAYASMVPQYPGYNYGVTTVGPNGPQRVSGGPAFSFKNMSQVYSFGVTPSLVQRFGGWGTLTGSVSLAQSLSSNGYYNNTQNGFQDISAFGSTTTLQEQIAYTTGENLGQFQNDTRLSATQMRGTGVTQQASSMTARNTLSYAVTRWATVLGQIGYQKIDYPNAYRVTNNQVDTNSRRYSVESVIWNIGGKFIPDANSQITVGYGRFYGTNNFNLDAYYAISPRTTIFATVQTGLGTGLGQLQNNLFNPGGAQPGQPPIGPGFLPGNRNVYLTKTASIGGSLTQERDAFSLSVSAADQKVVATTVTDPNSPTPPQVQGSSRSFSANGSWTHQFTEAMSGSVYGSFGTNRGVYYSNSMDYFISSQASLNYVFSPSLTGALQYYFYDLISQTPNRSYTQSTITLSIHKQF